jgi:hypothetical protein
MAEHPEEEEEELDLCPVCELYDTQDVVLVCDGCEACYHPACLGLDEIPAGNWFCPECMTSEIEAPVMPRRTWPASSNPGSPPRSQDRVREAHRRRARHAELRRDEHRGRSTVDRARPAWSNISSRIHAAAGLELDFLDDDPSMANFRRLQRRASEETRELLEWEERLNSANRRIATGAVATTTHPNPVARITSTSGATGAASNRANSISHQRSTSRTVREAVSSDERSRRTTPVRERSTPASPEQALAWGDLDRAQNLDTATSGARKRRAESVGSPAEQSERQEPERKLKRPRTRAVPDNNNASSSSSSSSNQTPNRPAISTTNEPSFLASLLREVESATGEDRFHWSPSVSVQEPATSPSTYHLSPITSPSPASSTFHTPRALSLTPPPQHPVRTASAHSISSRSRSPPPSSIRQVNEPTSPTLEIRQPRPRRQEEFVRPRSLETSPVRATMPIDAKESINKIVKSALGPHWRSAQLSKDQYSDINRDVSRKMYEIVADEYSNIERDRSAWETIAAREVAAAVRALAV